MRPAHCDAAPPGPGPLATGEGTSDILFLARGLTFASPEREGTQQITVVRLPFAEALTHVLDGTIAHAPSVAAILKARLRAA